MNVLLATTDIHLADQIVRFLAEHDYRVIVTRDCRKTVGTAQEMGVGLDAILLDSAIVYCAIHRGEDIISELRSAFNGNPAPILVLMTRQFETLEQDVKDASLRADGVVHLPVRPADVYVRLDSALSLTR